MTTAPAAPEPVRRIVEAMVSRALSRCAHLGISEEAFYRAFQEERKQSRGATLPELFNRAFRRLTESEPAQ